MRELNVASTLAEPTQSNTADFVFTNALLRPAHVALRRRRDRGWSDVTSAQFATEVVGLAKGLMAHGIQAGDRIAVMSATRYEWTLTDLAVMGIGAVVVPIYETSSAEQVHWIISDAGCRAIFVETSAHAQILTEVQADTPSLVDIWQFEADSIARLTATGASITDQEFTARRSGTTLTGLASIIYTSGTTGRPKGCELTHGNFISEVRELQSGLRDFFNENTSTLLFLPIAHVFGRAIQLGCIATGCALGHAADVKNLVADLAEFQPTFILSVPRVFEKVYDGAKLKAYAAGRGRIFDRAEKISIAYSRALSTGSVPIGLKVQHAVADRLVYSKLRAALGGHCVAAVSGGAPLSERLGHFFRGAGVTIYEGYGLTETTAGICVNTPGALRIGTVGRPIGGAAVRVSDDGELLLRGGVLFDGYWDNAAATDEAVDADGWFHSGDIGEIDADGFVSITGRKKELIVTAAGKNVAPAGLEDRIRAHWLIGQALVVGDRQPFIAAVITLDPAALPQWLSAHKRPADTELAELVDDPELRSDVQRAITDANKSVSRAEAIKKFVVLATDWTEAGGQITPSLKLKRNVVQAEHADQIAALFTGGHAD